MARKEEKLAIQPKAKYKRNNNDQTPASPNHQLKYQHLYSCKVLLRSILPVAPQAISKFHENEKSAETRGSYLDVFKRIFLLGFVIRLLPLNDCESYERSLL